MRSVEARFCSMNDRSIVIVKSPFVTCSKRPAGFCGVLEFILTNLPDSDLICSIHSADYSMGMAYQVLEFPMRGRSAPNPLWHAIPTGCRSELFFSPLHCDAHRLPSSSRD